MEQAGTFPLVNYEKIFDYAKGYVRVIGDSKRA